MSDSVLYASPLQPREAGARTLGSGDWMMLLVAGSIAALAALTWWLGDMTMAAVITVPILVLLLLFHFPAVLYVYGFVQATDPMFVLDRFFTFGKVIGLLIPVLALLHLRKLTSAGALPRAARSILGWAVALTMAGALTVIWSADPLRSSVAAAQMIVQLLGMLVIIQAVATIPSVASRMLLWVAAGAAVASVYLLVFGMSQSTYGRATLSEETNPNTAALGLTICFGCLPLLWVLWRSWLVRAGALCVAVLVLTALFHTGSRAAVVAALIGLPAGVLLTRAGNVIKKVVITFLLLGIAYAAGLVVLEYADLGEKAEARLASMLGVAQRGGDSSALLEDSRITLWKMHFESWLSTGGFGTGIGVSAQAAANRRGTYMDVHSSVVGSLVEMGLAGFVAFCGLILVTMWRIRNVSRVGWRIGLMTLLVTSGLFMLTHTTYTTKWFWFPIAFIAAMVELDARLGPSADATVQTESTGYGFVSPVA